MFFLTDYIQSHFLLTLGHLDIIEIFFDSRKIRISVFYKKENIELVYILQKRVEMGIVYFFLTDYIQSNFAINIGVPR